MNDSERDVIYVINRYSNLVSFTWRTKRIVLPYDTPVAVDFTDDPTLVSNLLQCPELQVCSKKELADYRARAQARVAAQKVEPAEVVQTDSEIENLLEEGSNE